jgi:hypothetical protein
MIFSAPTWIKHPHTFADLITLTFTPAAAQRLAFLADPPSLCQPVNRRRGISLFLFCVLLCLTVPQSPGAQQNILAFTHATVIDATGAPALKDVTVVIKGDRISALGKSDKVRPPSDAQIVNARGKFLIPGLWDMHVHWYVKDYLPLFIANGVTGIRIMSGTPAHHQWRKEIAEGSLLGPRMLIASPIVDGPKPFWPGSVTAGNEEEGRQAVAKAMQDGADFVKVYSVLPRDAYFGIADEAKKRGIPFEGHVPFAVSVREASQAGQKSIEHLTGVLLACSSRENELLKSAQAALAGVLATNEPMTMVANNLRSEEVALETYSAAKASEVFADFRRNHTWQCPTLTVLRNVACLDDPAFGHDPRLKYMPRQVKSIWDPDNDFRFKGRTAEGVAIGKKVYQKELELVGAMRRSGVEFLAGTDTLNPFCFPGFSLHDELGLLVQTGFTPMEALQTATLNAARFMGRENDLGTIKAGKLADLILLDANPLDDIANTRKIGAVVYGGRLFPRPALNEMLSRVEALANIKSIAEPLLKIIDEKNVEAAVKEYRELKAADPAGYDFGEEELNSLGYQLIGRKRIKDAIAIFKLNVEAYPQSSNTYDSLGEAYLDDGNKELAAENYERSLNLDPSNGNANEKLKQLKVH